MKSYNLVSYSKTQVCFKFDLQNYTLGHGALRLSKVPNSHIQQKQLFVTVLYVLEISFQLTTDIVKCNPYSWQLTHSNHFSG